jgi:hypothetical protein
MTRSKYLDVKGITQVPVFVELLSRGHEIVKS